MINNLSHPQVKFESTNKGLDCVSFRSLAGPARMIDVKSSAAACIETESQCRMAALRITELANPVTADIDVATLAGLVRLFGTSDAQLFSGYNGLPGLHDDETLSSVAHAIKLVAIALSHPRGRVIFSGAGTSGRLSHLESLSLNKLAASLGVSGDRFSYLLAGGDAALLLAQEAAEDQAEAGRGDLRRFIETAGLQASDPVVVIGISCGLSATYVGSMLEYALSLPNASPVCLGFNPVESIREVKVDGWAGSMYDILSAMTTPAHRERCAIINPVLGPESIAGSSRMKGGSATKIILETIGLLAIQMARGSNVAPKPISDHQLYLHIRDCFLQYEVTARHVYSHVPSIASLVSAASTAVNTIVDKEQHSKRAAESAESGAGFVSPTGRGRILYVGVGAAGLLALIDASECSPTYGSLFNDVRGFLGGGWADLQNKEGPLSMCTHKHMRGDAGLPSHAFPEVIKLGVGDGFMTDLLPTLNAADLVIIVAIDDAEGASPSTGWQSSLNAVSAAAGKGCTVRHIVIDSHAMGYAATAASPSTPSSLMQAVTAVAPEGVHVTLPCTALTADLRYSRPQASDGDVKSEASQASSAPSQPQYLAELALKLVLNATTTGAHIRKGTIYRNRMINMMLTNAKLFHRSVGIVADVAGCDKQLAQQSILRALYDVDSDSAGAEQRLEELRAAPALSHVAQASSMLNIIPLAILLSASEATARKSEAATTAAPSSLPSQNLTVQATRRLLTSEPVIRKAIARALSSV